MITPRKVQTSGCSISGAKMGDSTLREVRRVLSAALADPTVNRNDNDAVIAAARAKHPGIFRAAEKALFRTACVKQIGHVLERRRTAAPDNRQSELFADLTHPEMVKFPVQRAGQPPEMIVKPFRDLLEDEASAWKAYRDRPKGKGRKATEGMAVYERALPFLKDGRAMGEAIAMADAAAGG